MKSHQKHPLFELASIWASDADDHTIPFAPLREFENYTCEYAEEGPEARFEAEWAREFYLKSAILGKAISGSSECDRALHQLLYQSSGSLPGKAACHAASLAYQTNHWAGFCESLALPGFKDALCEWAKNCMPGDGIDIPDALRWIIENLTESDPDLTNRFIAHILDGYRHNPAEFIEVVANAQRAVSTKNKRNPKSSSTTIKHYIRLCWVPMALWCRSDLSILQMAGDKHQQNGNGLRRVKEGIQMLGYANTWRSELEGQLKA